MKRRNTTKQFMWLRYPDGDRSNERIYHVLRIEPRWRRWVPRLVWDRVEWKQDSIRHYRNGALVLDQVPLAIPDVTPMVQVWLYLMFLGRRFVLYRSTRRSIS